MQKKNQPDLADIKLFHTFASKQVFISIEKKITHVQIHIDCLVGFIRRQMDREV
jgi:hypothetical protein